MADIVTENALTGTGPEIWDIAGAGDPAIQGFAAQMSVNVGDTVDFKIDTTATAYRVDVYRLGHYAGRGARQVARLQPAVAPQVQPLGLLTPGSGLLDCANWAVSVSWPVPVDATSGIYLAHLVGEDGVTGESHVPFVVRDDARAADVLFQASDTTWQAYNAYGDSCLYEFLTASGVRASEVSYNRPFLTREAEGGANWLFNAEHAAVRFLESNGYDVAYCAGADVDRDPGLLARHRVFLSVGHDEYWSADQRANVEAARDAGVHLAFLSGNEVFWKTRWEDDADGVPYRTLVCYKDTLAGEAVDPAGVWTGTWRDARFSPPLDGGRPENALTGTRFGAQGFTDHAIRVSAAEGKLRLWRHTPLASLASGDSETLAVGTLGYEWDECPEDSRPPGLITLSGVEIATPDLLLDEGATFGSGVATHHVTLYRHSGGALVFSAGTAQWTWGLDAVHDTHGSTTGPADTRMQQATVNLLADMGVQPAGLRPGLTQATAPPQAAVPASVILEPADGEVLEPGVPVTVSGTATVSAGRVGAVEVSVDGGLTWRPAQGRGAWTAQWSPQGHGTVVVRSRAVADDGHVETPTAGVAVTVGGPADPGPGGPVLVVVNGSATSAHPFGGYLTEILRAEGLVAFESIELTDLMASADPLQRLRASAVVLLAHTPLLPDQRDLFAEFVVEGGRIIAMRPDPALASVLGLAHQGLRAQDGPDPRRFLELDTTADPGVGVTSGPLQYHGDADDYLLDGATALAHFRDDLGTPSSTPAVTVARHGSGSAVAFAFDLAASVVLMRQGNPAWANTEGDAAAGVARPLPSESGAGGEYRPMDMFCRVDGALWFEPSLLQVPQADELQRFFANVVLDTADRRLPRLWYLPGTHRTVIVNTGDGEHYTPEIMQVPMDHAAAHGATFTTYLRREQINGTFDPAIILTPATEAAWRAAGHGVGVHVFSTDASGANVQTFDSVRDAYADITGALRTMYGHGARTARSHTIDWTGWVNGAAIEAEFGTALDLNYYHYWQFAATAPDRFPQLALPVIRAEAYGWFTGSGLAQRFCDENGAVLPIHQLLTPWADEFFADNGYSAAEVIDLIDEMVDASENGYHSAFVANLHHGRYLGDDPITGTWAQEMWLRAAARGIPLVCAEDHLDFLEARASARLSDVVSGATTLVMDVVTGAGGGDVTAMVPADGLVALTVDGSPVSPTITVLAGRSWAMITATSPQARVRASYA